MSKVKSWAMLAALGLSMKMPKSNVKIETQPLISKKESSKISKQRLKKMKGKKTRGNRGRKRRKQ